MATLLKAVWSCGFMNPGLNMGTNAALSHQNEEA